MKAISTFALGLATLVVALTFSNPAFASCGKKSKQKPMRNMSGMENMNTNDDMPMCCRMEMKHRGKETPETEKQESGAAMGSMGEKEVKDPVCLMTVEPETAEKSIYQSKNYYFCSKGHRNMFEKSPARYVNDTGSSSSL